MVRRTKGAMASETNDGQPKLRLTVQDEETGELQQRDFPEYPPLSKAEEANPGLIDPTVEPETNAITTGDVKAFIHERFPQP